MPVRPINVEKVTVLTGRLSVLVRVAPGMPRTSTPQLAAQLRERFPTLPSHACVNDVGETFGCVMGATSLPHVLEHLVIDLQARAHAQGGEQLAPVRVNAAAPTACVAPASARVNAARVAPAPSADPLAAAPAARTAPSPRTAAAPPSAPAAPTFVGTTEWLDEPAGLAHVQVSFADDLIALRALRDAADILNQAVVS